MQSSESSFLRQSPDVFDIQSQGEGHLLLVRLESPKPGPGMSMESCLEAIAAAPLRPKKTWELPQSHDPGAMILLDTNV